MKSAIFVFGTLLGLCVLAGCGSYAKSSPIRGAKTYPPVFAPVCFLSGTPPTDVEYEKIGYVNSTKRSYGNTEDLFPLMANQARRLGADAIMNLHSGQRFKGPLPWRMMAPTGSGIAIKVLPDPSRLDCEKAGGHIY